MIVKIANNIEVGLPTRKLKKWCDENLVLNNPEYAKKQRMGFWVGNTPKQISLYEVNGDNLILPYGVLREIPKDILASTFFLDRHHEPTEVDYGGEPIDLYDYQEHAVQALIEAKYGILQAPAGSGKSITMIELIKRLGLKALWLTHTHDLLEQSKGYADRYMDPDLVGTITEGKVNIGKGITFATIQTISNLDLTLYRDIWDVIVTDECHRIAGSPTKVTQFYRVINQLDAPYKYGMSATVHRSDGLIKAALALIGRVVYTIDDKAVGDKVMEVGIKPIITGVKIAEDCLNVDGTINYANLITYLTKSIKRNVIIANLIIENKGHSCLILSDRLEHLKTLINILPSDIQKEAVMISGKMTSKKGKAERDQAIRDMKEGKKKYLFATYSLAKEGLDIPRLDRLIMATPIKDYAVVIQAIGRIARVHKTKDKPLCYDLIDDIGYCLGAYKARCRHYKKTNCYFVEGQ